MRRFSNHLHWASLRLEGQRSAFGVPLTDLTVLIAVTARRVTYMLLPSNRIEASGRGGNEFTPGPQSAKLLRFLYSTCSRPLSMQQRPSSTSMAFLFDLLFSNLKVEHRGPIHVRKGRTGINSVPGFECVLAPSSNITSHCLRRLTGSSSADLPARGVRTWDCAISNISSKQHAFPIKPYTLSPLELLTPLPIGACPFVAYSPGSPD